MGPNPRKPRRTKAGVVTSDRMDKTIAVRVNWLYEVPKYGKRVRRHTVYYAHDEQNEAHVGDEVEIRQTRPRSKLKRWRLVRIVRRGDHVVPPSEAAKAPALDASAGPAAPPEGAGS